MRAAGYFVLLLLFLIGLFLFLQGWPALHKAGLRVLHHVRVPRRWLHHPVYGVLASLVGTLEVAAVAMVVGTPVAIATAIFLSEYAPMWSRRTLIALVDLAAAIPSIIFGLLGGVRALRTTWSGSAPGSPATWPSSRSSRW